MQYSVSPNPNVAYEVRYADEDLLVVDKPPGVVTQPGKKHEHDSLLNGLFERFGRQLQNVGAERGWGLLHRLDKETSGLVLVALGKRAYDGLLEQFKKRQVKKIYWAIVRGVPQPAQGVIQKPIRETVGQRKHAAVHRDGQPSITSYRVLQTGPGSVGATAAGSAGDVSLIEARPKTGRMHQIRLHLAEIGHPLLGEDLYQGDFDMPRVPRLCLHAAGLSFTHPITSKRIEVHSPWPADLRTTLRRFGFREPE